MCCKGEGGLGVSGVDPAGSETMVRGEVDSAGGLNEPAPVVLGSAGVADEDAVDDVFEDEMAQSLEDLPVQDLGQPEVVLNGLPLLCQTTILVVNAAGLVEGTGDKFRAFHKMVKDLDPKPDIIVVHELGGYSGVEKIQFKLVGALRRYDCVYTQKPLMRVTIKLVPGC